MASSLNFAPPCSLSAIIFTLLAADSGVTASSFWRLAICSSRTGVTTICAIR
jgi:hypothetical protein